MSESDSASVSEKTTGQDGSRLGWMVVGAAAVAALVVPLVIRFLNISATLALVLVGAALAYFTYKKGVAKQSAFHHAGAGAAIFGLASFAVTLLGPVLGGLNPFGGAQARGQQTGQTTPTNSPAPGNGAIFI